MAPPELGWTWARKKNGSSTRKRGLKVQGFEDLQVTFLGEILWNNKLVFSVLPLFNKVSKHFQKTFSLEVSQE